MKHTDKIFIFIVLLLFCSNIFAQNTPNDVVYQSSTIERLKAPLRIAIDNQDNTYVTDVSAKKIFKYDATGALIKAFDFVGTPVSIAISNDNKIFVGDTKAGKIFQISSDNTQTEFYTTLFPSSMVFDTNNLLYVSDSKLGHIKVLNMSGELVRIIGNGDFAFPTGIAFDKKNNRILVAEHGGVGPDVQKCGDGMMAPRGPVLKIYAYDLDGNLLTSFGCFGYEDGLFYRVQGLTVSENGLIYAVDPTLKRISVFEENGVFLNKFGEEGGGQLNMPMDIAFNSQNKAFVSSMNNSKIEIFDINEINPTSEITSSDKIICSGETANIIIDFAGTAPWTFTYTIDDVSATTITTNTDPYTLTVSEAGTYKITALSDANYDGTTFTGSTIITANPFPTATISSGNEEICPGETSDIVIDFTGEAPFNLTYTVDNANATTLQGITQNSFILNVAEAGIYKITSLTGGSCPASDILGEAQITINQLPASIILNSNASICAGEVATIPVELVGNMPFDIIYTVDGVNPQTISNIVTNQFTFNVSEAGLYEIAAVSDISATGVCFTGNAQIDVNQLPTAVISNNDASICYGDFMDIQFDLTGTPPFSFTYYKDDVTATSTFFNVSQNSYIQRITDAGKYKLMSVNDAYCSKSNLIDEFNLSINTLPTASLISDNTITEICIGETIDLQVDLSGTPPFNLTYALDKIDFITIENITGTTIPLTVLKEGIYEIFSITDANCANQNYVGSHEIIFKPLSEINLGDDIVMCEGEVVSLNAGTGFLNYSWSNQSTNQTLDVSVTGNYSVEVTDNNGCTANDEITVTVNSNPLSVFTFDANYLEVSFVNNSIDADIYTWNFSDGTTSNEQNPVHTFASEGNYTVSLTAANQLCTENTISQTINVVASSIENSHIENFAKIYPNPSNGLFTIEFANISQSNISIEITSVTGQLILSKEIQSNTLNEQFDLPNVANGLYTIKLISERFVKTGILVISY